LHIQNKERVPRMARPAIQAAGGASSTAHLLPSSMLSMASITLRPCAGLGF
jgi:hypothetical protein